MSTQALAGRDNNSRSEAEGIEAEGKAGKATALNIFQSFLNNNVGREDKAPADPFSAANKLAIAIERDAAADKASPPRPPIGKQLKKTAKLLASLVMSDRPVNKGLPLASFARELKTNHVDCIRGFIQFSLRMPSARPNARYRSSSRQ